MRAILAALLGGALLWGCVSTPPAATPASPNPIAPPGVLFTAPWQWMPQGVDSPELLEVLSVMKTPEATEAWLRANTEWRADVVDGYRFMSPNDFASRRAGVCKDFARFWVRALAGMGIAAEFVAFWTEDGGAHAVAVFEYPAGVWRLASNQDYYEDVDLARGERGRRAALARAADEFYPGRWVNLEVYQDGAPGPWQQIPVKTAIAPLLAPTPGAVSAWPIKR